VGGAGLALFGSGEKHLNSREMETQPVLLKEKASVTLSLKGFVLMGVSRSKAEPEV